MPSYGGVDMADVVVLLCFGRSPIGSRMATNLRLLMADSEDIRTVGPYKFNSRDQMGDSATWTFSRLEQHRQSIVRKPTKTQEANGIV